MRKINDKTIKNQEKHLKIEIREEFSQSWGNWFMFRI